MIAHIICNHSSLRCCLSARPDVLSPKFLSAFRRNLLVKMGLNPKFSGEFKFGYNHPV